MTIRTAVISALAAAALVATAACSAQPGVAAADDSAAPGTGQVQPASYATDTTPSRVRVINATGTGTVSGTPDTVTVQLGVSTRAVNASAALAENNKAANAVIGKLRAYGLGEKDLQTSGLYVYPTYSDNGSAITGYEVSNTVTATLHDVTKAGGLIDTAEKAAGNAIRVDGISFSFADDSELRAQARKAAVEQAMAQAKQLADAAGVQVGQILSISEGAGYETPMPMYAADAGSSAGSAPILPGSADLAVTVQIAVEIG